MSKKPSPKENKKYTAEFKSEAIKLAERLSVTPPDLAQTYTSEIQNRLVQSNVLDGSQANIKKQL